MQDQATRFGSTETGELRGALGFAHLFQCVVYAEGRKGPVACAVEKSQCRLVGLADGCVDLVPLVLQPSVKRADVRDVAHHERLQQSQEVGLSHAIAACGNPPDETGRDAHPRE